VEALRPCSGKMARILRAALMDYGRVVLVDAEDRRPEDVEREVAERHLSGGGGRGLVVAARPCIEEWACHALRLEVCGDVPPDVGPLRSIDQYWRRRHERPYQKRFLPMLFEEAFSGVDLDEVVKRSVSLRRFLEALLKN